MSIWVKICGLTDVKTALAACEAGANAIGLVFAESPRKVGIPAAREIIKALPDRVEVFGVVRGYNVDEIRALLAEVELDVLQIHCDDGMFPDFDFGVELVPAIPANFLAAYGTSGLAGRRFIADAPAGGGSGKVWKFQNMAGPGQRMILAGGLTPGNVKDAIAKAKPWGVDVSSGVEVQRGKKDTGLIQEFIKAARS